MDSSGSYKVARLKALVLIDALNEKLAAHAERQTDDPANWGFVGDLNEINIKLAEAVAFLS